MDHPLHGDGADLNQMLTVISYNVMDGGTGDYHDLHKITLDDGSQWYPVKPTLYDILAIQTLE